MYTNKIIILILLTISEFCFLSVIVTIAYVAVTNSD